MDCGDVEVGDEVDNNTMSYTHIYTQIDNSTLTVSSEIPAIKYIHEDDVSGF